MDRLVEKSRLRHCRQAGINAIEGSSRLRQGAGALESKRIGLYPWEHGDGPGRRLGPEPPRSLTGLGAGNGSGPWPWPGWGPVLEERPKQAGTYRSLEPKGETLGLGKE